MICIECKMYFFIFAISFGREKDKFPHKKKFPWAKKNFSPCYLRTIKTRREKKTKPLYKKLHFSSLYKFKNVIHVVH